jgi:predicted nucleic acid-binding protein
VRAIALDTNVLVYAEGVERTPADVEKIRQSRDLMRQLTASHSRPTVPLQVLAELHHVLVRRDGRTSGAARRIAENWISRTNVAAGNTDTFVAALSLAADHGLQIFDSLILATAADAGCDALLSEDLHDGFVWRGVEVINPYAVGGRKRLARLIAN